MAAPCFRRSFLVAGPQPGLSRDTRHHGLVLRAFTQRSRLCETSQRTECGGWGVGGCWWGQEDVGGC